MSMQQETSHMTAAPQTNGHQIFPEIDMSAGDSSSIVRATVVQASTVFYDTPATLGSFLFSRFLIHYGW